jgi:toxin ParE1/3/4
MARVLKTAEAEDSLLAIGRYIARESQSLDRAMRVLDRIDEKCRLYAERPLIGQSREDLGPGVRCFPIDSYVAVYRPVDDGILVLVVAHGHQDIPVLFRQLFGYE